MHLTLALRDRPAQTGAIVQLFLGFDDWGRAVYPEMGAQIEGYFQTGEQ